MLQADFICFNVHSFTAEFRINKFSTAYEIISYLLYIEESELKSNKHYNISFSLIYFYLILIYLHKMKRFSVISYILDWATNVRLNFFFLTLGLILSWVATSKKARNK